MVFSAHSKKSDNAAAEIWQSVVGDPTPKSEETLHADDVAAWSDEKFWGNPELPKTESTSPTENDSWSEPEPTVDVAESEETNIWGEPEENSPTEDDGWGEEQTSIWDAEDKKSPLWSEPEFQSEPTAHTIESEKIEPDPTGTAENDPTPQQDDSFLGWNETEPQEASSIENNGWDEPTPQQDDSFFDWGEPDSTEDDSVENSTSEGFWGEEEQSTVDNSENFWGSNEEQPETLPQQSKKTIEVSDNPGFWAGDNNDQPQQSQKTGADDSSKTTPDNNETAASSWDDDFLETVSTPEESVAKPLPIKPIIIGVTALTIVLALVVGGLFGVRALRTKQANQESCQALQEVIAEYQQVVHEAGLLGLKVNSRRVGCSDTAGNRQAISDLQHAIREQKTKNTPALTKAIEQRQAQLQALQSQYPDNQTLKVLSVPKKAEEFASFDKRLAQLAKTAQQEADKKRQEVEQKKAEEEKKAQEQRQVEEQKEAEHTQSQQYTAPQQQYQTPQQPYRAPSVPAPQPATPAPQPPSGNADVEF